MALHLQAKSAQETTHDATVSALNQLGNTAPGLQPKRAGQLAEAAPIPSSKSLHAFPSLSVPIHGRATPPLHGRASPLVLGKSLTLSRNNSRQHLPDAALPSHAVSLSRHTSDNDSHSLSRTGSRPTSRPSSKPNSRSNSPDNTSLKVPAPRGVHIHFLHQRGTSLSSLHSFGSVHSSPRFGAPPSLHTASPLTSPNASATPFARSVKHKEEPAEVAPSPIGFRGFALTLASPACRTPHKAQWGGSLMQKEEERQRQEALIAKERYNLQLHGYFQFPAPAPRVDAAPIPEVVVVGRVPTERDLELVRIAKASIAFSHNTQYPELLRQACAVRNFVRGAYFIYNSTELEGLACSPTVDLPPAAHTAITDYLQMPPVAIFKPHCEVRGMPHCKKAHKQFGEMHPAKRGVPPAFETANEVIVSGLRVNVHGHLVVETTLTDNHFFDRTAKDEDSQMITKRGSLQEFIPPPYVALSSIPLDERELVVQNIPLASVQKLAILDLSMIGVDRNPHNLFINPSADPVKIMGIDQALIAPAGFESPSELVWMKWPQSLQVFSNEAQIAIDELDLGADLDKIKAAYPDYPEANLEVLQFSYYLLKTGSAMGLSPFLLGCFYTGGMLSSGISTMYDQAKLIATRDKGGPAETRMHMINCINHLLEMVSNTFPQPTPLPGNAPGELPASVSADDIQLPTSADLSLSTELPSKPPASVSADDIQLPASADLSLSAELPSKPPASISAEAVVDEPVEDAAEEETYSIAKMQTKVELAIMNEVRQYFLQLANSSYKTGPVTLHFYDNTDRKQGPDDAE